MSEVVTALNDPDVSQTTSRSHFLLEVASKDEHLFVKVNSEICLAQLNHNLDECLKKLVESRNIRLQTVIHKATLFG